MEEDFLIPLLPQACELSSSSPVERNGHHTWLWVTTLSDSSVAIPSLQEHRFTRSWTCRGCPRRPLLSGSWSFLGSQCHVRTPGSCRPCLGFPSWCSGCEALSRLGLGSPRLILFPTSQGPLSFLVSGVSRLLSGVLCLPPLVVSGRRFSVVPVLPSWLEAQVSNQSLLRFLSCLSSGCQYNADCQGFFKGMCVKCVTLPP